MQYEIGKTVVWTMFSNNPHSWAFLIQSFNVFKNTCFSSLFFYLSKSRTYPNSDNICLLSLGFLPSNFYPPRSPLHQHTSLHVSLYVSDHPHTDPVPPPRSLKNLHFETTTNITAPTHRVCNSNNGSEARRKKEGSWNGAQNQEGRQGNGGDFYGGE